MIEKAATAAAPSRKLLKKNWGITLEVAGDGFLGHQWWVPLSVLHFFNAEGAHLETALWSHLVSKRSRSGTSSTTIPIFCDHFHIGQIKQKQTEME
jgi:hypothetical protein